MGNSTEVIWFLTTALKACAKVNYSWAGRAGAGRALGWLWHDQGLPGSRGGDFTAQKSQSAGVQSNCWGKTPRGWAVTNGELRAPLASHLGSIPATGRAELVARHSSPSHAAHTSNREGEAGKGFSGDLPGWFAVSKGCIAGAEGAGCEEGNYSIFALLNQRAQLLGSCVYLVGQR